MGAGGEVWGSKEGDVGLEKAGVNDWGSIVGQNDAVNGVGGGRDAIDIDGTKGANDHNERTCVTHSMNTTCPKSNVYGWGLDGHVYR